MALLVIAILLIAAGQTHAATIDELSQQIETKSQEIKKLEEEAKNYRDSIASNQQRGKTLKAEVARINTIINQIKNDIALTNKKIQRTQLEIEANGHEIKSKEASIQKIHSGLAHLIQGVSEFDQQSLIIALVAHPALSEFFQHIDNTASVNEKMLSSLDELRTFKKDLETKKKSAEEKRTELKYLQNTFTDRQKMQQNTRAEQATLLTATQNQEKKYQQMLATTEEKQEEILKEIEELESSLRQLVDPNSLPAQRKGLLAWPVTGRITQGYGNTPFARSSDFYKFHNGIDISAAYGTPLHAADDGIIHAVGDTDRYCRRGAYGKYIVIDHQNNLTTMYAHLSLIRVTNGQKVARGDILGYTGNSGLSTGPHLHFTLYDSRTVEIKLGKIGTCGVLPFGGSINPLVYL